MRITELIINLEHILKEHGDLEVETYSLLLDRKSINKPEIAYRKILSKRQSKPDFWCKYSDTEEVKGEKITKI